MYSVRLSRQAQKAYGGAPRSLAKKLARCFVQLEEDPRRHSNITPLRGDLAGLYRYRVGDHRIVYQIDDEHNSVIVLVIAHRREAYK